MNCNKYEAELVIRFFSKMSKITPYVFISNAEQAVDLQFIRKSKIECVLCCALELHHSFPKEIMFKKLPIRDSKRFNILNYLEEGVEFIAEAVSSSRNILVYCNMGVSRSPTIVIAYLVKELQIPTDEAESLVLKSRPEIFPNSGFYSQLKIYESKNLKLKKPKNQCNCNLF